MVRGFEVPRALPRRCVGSISESSLNARRCSSWAVWTLVGLVTLTLFGGCPFQMSPDAGVSSLSVRGANLVGFQTEAYTGPDNRLGESLGTFATDGGNWIAVTFWWFQDSVSASEITPDYSLYSITDAAIEAAVQAAQGQGLRVLLRPMLDTRGNGWRGEIQPSDAWFDSYRGYILAYANKADQWGVAAFSVGAELSATEPWEHDWRRLIDEVRDVYPGLVIYSAVHDAALRLGWWDAVDVIGIDEYAPVALFPGTDTIWMTLAWSFWLHQLELGVANRFPNRPVWLTEVGVRSARGAASQPWCWQDPCGGFVDARIVDLMEQANYYRAALHAVSARPWVEGLFWWSWDPDPGAPHIAGPDFSPQGKPAEDVIAAAWDPASESH